MLRTIILTYQAATVVVSKFEGLTKPRVSIMITIKVIFQNNIKSESNFVPTSLYISRGSIFGKPAACHQHKIKSLK